MTDDESTWRFVHFGLLVTGKGEEQFLPDFLRALRATGHCAFQVIRRIGQRSPIVSQKRQLQMVGQGKKIPDRDAEEIGLPARGFLSRSAKHFVLLIDDLEGRDANAVFGRYRTALDTMLPDPDHRKRASVHFLVRMVEAYFLAHAAAVALVLDLELADHPGDVEADIAHPKNHLKRLFRGYDEVAHGRQIVQVMDLEHVLSRVETCAWLRSLVSWCNAAIGDPVTVRFRLVDGNCAALTLKQ